jgi:hypothetical protein
VKAEQKEKLGTKLRRKGDILKVLRGGGHLVHTTEGLYRTPGALRALESAGQNPADFLERHLNCDWGNLDRDDIRENEYALQHGLRLLSSYHLNDGTRIWIITEADRSATTLLLPEEY